MGGSADSVRCVRKVQSHRIYILAKYTVYILGMTSFYGAVSYSA